MEKLPHAGIFLQQVDGDCLVQEIPSHPIRSKEEKMVVLVVATTSDPASIGPAAAFLAMPGWSPGPPIAVRTKQSFCLNPIYKSRFGPSTRVLRYLLFYSNSYASTTNIICGVSRPLGVAVLLVIGS